MGGSVVGTHMANGLNLLFPAGERFFVRSVHRYLDRIRDPELRKDVKSFSGQEGRHANAHERYFEALENQGYAIRGFLRFYEKFAYGIVEPSLPPQLRLAATAACEHFTATLASAALAENHFADADPTMRALLLWHAVEEIEHKSVAFDVLQAVNPSRGLRIAGLAIAGTMLGGLWIAAAVTLIAQDGSGVGRIVGDLHKQRERPPRKLRLGRAIRNYARPGFHPSKYKRDGELARAYVEDSGLGAA
jgi:predicted metal-dependent hydrolase